MVKSLRKNRNPNGFFKSESGVSEVLGDILLVSMSVVLVAVIAYQVSSIETPVESTKIDLVATLEDDFLVIAHKGGERLEEDYIKIYVGTGPQVSRSFNISDGLGGERVWSLGQEWRANISTEISAAAITNSQIYVQVVDVRQNTIILDQVLRRGVSTELFPDVGLDKTSFVFSEDNPDNDVFITMSVKVVNYGPINVTNINVRFFDGKTFIGANNTITHINHTGLAEDNITVNLRWRTTFIGKHVISVKAVPKLNETNLANNYLSKNLVVGAGVNPDFIKPNLILKTLTFSKESPKSKETVVVTAEVGNTAKITATGFTLRWGDLFEGANTTINTTVYTNNVTYVKGATVKFEWTPDKGGSHKFWALIEDVKPDGEDPKADADPDLDRDYLERDIEVLPTILLVDDDRAGRGAAKDTVTYMREALNSIGVSPDIVTVSGGDGPQYTGTGVTLDDYDVVIWMTGYEQTNTITTSGPTNDVDNLEQYLDNNGSLWLIGQDIVDDLWLNGGANGNNFLANYLRVSGQTLNIGVTSTIKGNDNVGYVAGLTATTRIPSGLPNRADVIVPNGAVSAFDNATGSNLSLLSNQTTRSDPNSDHKVALFAFEFAHIKSSSDRAIISYEIMQWFNATVALEGEDVAVSEVIITPRNPHYKQEVLIKATVRNNGLNDLTGVKVVFKEVYSGIEKIIDSVAVPDLKRAPNPLTDSPDTNNPMSVDLDEKGGINITYKYWTPEKIGLHAIKVVVDPNDVIKEFNEENNEFQSILDPTSVFVDAITLVVDDDQVASGDGNTTQTIVETLEFLNYKYDVYNVTALTSGNGPGIDNLTKYNSIVWCLGDANVDTLKDEDTTNLSSYLTNYDDSKLLIVGQNLVDDNNFWTNTTFRQNILGLDGASTGAGTPSTLYGVDGNNITHGAVYGTSATGTYGDDADTLTPGTGTEAILNSGSGSPYVVAFHNTTGVDYKVITMSFEFEFIQSDNHKRELFFNILHWFGQIDSRIELRVTLEDMYFGQDDGPSIAFENSNPVLGDSYILQAKIWNLGGTPGGAVVRFVDGTTVINSVNVYVPASIWDEDGDLIPGTGIAEVIWTPLFAGTRPITVKVDPDQNIKTSTNPRDTTGEIFKFNNNATRTIEVYFFYDDMEETSENWNHDATILHINGEQPIEYFDRLRPVSTNIIDDFDWTESNNWDKNLEDGHSLPSSYKMNEPFDINLSTAFDLKVAICIDDSGSMQWNDPNDIRLIAANNFVQNVMTRPGDQVAVYSFTTSLPYGGSGVRNLEQFYGTGNLYESNPFNNTTMLYLNDTPGFGNSHGGIRYFWSLGGTPFYACMQTALAQMNAWAVPNQYPVIIGLTDGASNWGIGLANFLPIARSSKVPIYTIGLGAGVVTEQLYDTAEVSNGGKYYFASSADVLNQTFSRIASDIGGGTSRSLPEEGGSGAAKGGVEGPSSRTTDSRDDSGRAVQFLQIINPNGGEAWAQGIYRNVSWACRATTQANCGQATIQISVDGGGWQNVASGVGDELHWPDMDGDALPESYNWWSSTLNRMYPSDPNNFNWYYDGQAWRNIPRSCRWGFTCDRVYVYNWTVPEVTSNNVRLRVSVTDAGSTVNSDSGQFTIFDMGIILGGSKAAEVYNLTTEEFQLVNYEEATLDFWQRYDLLYTENGAVVLIGTAAAKAGPYQYKYAEPTQPYTGNVRLDKTVTDDVGNEIKWAWNGRSGGGTFSWEPIEVDLTPYINPARPWVKVRFAFYTWGFGNGGSWWLDDIKVTVQRADTTAIAANMADQWEYFEWQSGVDPAALEPHSGTHMWWNHNPAASNDTKSGLDNSLYSKSIDLTNAKDAHLSAYFMFNFDDGAGRPPDGFRVEISDNNGVTWHPINLGVRASWGMSGDWATDGKSPDGTQAYTGIQDNGLDSNNPVWVESGTLWRLNTNLSGWAGSVIKIRFRVVTNLDATHYENPTTFRGFAVDDVIIRGNTTIASAPFVPAQDDKGAIEHAEGSKWNNGLIEKYQGTVGGSYKD